MAFEAAHPNHGQLIMNSSNPLIGRTDLAALIKDAETDVARGCGQSDVLYESRVQAAYASILDRAPESERAETEAALRERGFDRYFDPYEAEEGECSLTGIGVDCCPCGRHD